MASTSSTTWIRKGEGYVEFNTPYAADWRAQPIAYPEPLDYERTTLYDVFVSNAAKYTDKKPLFGYRPCLDFSAHKYADHYEWLSWQTCADRVAAIGSGLMTLTSQATAAGVRQQETHVGIFSNNCPDWFFAEYGCFRQNLVVTPIYSTCGQGTINTIVRHAEISIAFCHVSLLPTLLRDVNAAAAAADETTAEEQQPLKVVITIAHEIFKDAANNPATVVITEEVRALAAKMNITLMDINQLMAAGRQTPSPATPPKPTDVCSIIYTSGSEGTPKGVVQLHKNYIAASDALLGMPVWEVDPDHLVYFSYLPLAHVFERSALGFIMRSGGEIGFSSGQLPQLVTELELVRPHCMICVPRVMQRIYDKINETVSRSSWLTRNVFNWAVSAKLESRRTGVATWVDYDKWVLSTVRAKLGGRLKWLINGAAAADPVISNWMMAVFDLHLLQGYGLTETFAGISTQHNKADGNPLSIGALFPFNTVRLGDVPDMNYLSTDVPPRGEIMVRGSTVMREYYKNPQATELAFTKDGFFCTGDIGKLDTDGTLQIIDRKKNLFKLPQGEYVALEYVETVYGRAKEVAQVWVWGHPLEGVLCAVVVPNWENATAGIRAAFPSIPLATAADHKAACQMSEVKKWMMDRLNSCADLVKMPSFQRVKLILLENEPWTIERNLLTPTFKLRRTELIKIYREKLDLLIAQSKN